jgi:hypothetical protein
MTHERLSLSLSTSMGNSPLSLYLERVYIERWLGSRALLVQQSKGLAAHSLDRSKKKWIQHHTVPGWSPTPVLSGLKPR